MSCQNEFLAIRSRKQRFLSSSQCASSSTRTWRSRIYSSTSLPPYGCPSQIDLDNVDLLDPLDEVTLNSDLDQSSTSSATLLSESDLSARLSGLHQSFFRYPLHEPGQMTAQRTQRLRARIASVIMSIPATCEDTVNVQEDELYKSAEAPLVIQTSRLRRVLGVRDLRRAFRDTADHGPAWCPSITSLGARKASHELGFLAAPTPLLSDLSPRSSFRTLVDLGNGLRKSSGDLKTLCESTLSSVSTTSRFATKVYPTFSSRSSHTLLPIDTSQPIFPRKYPVYNTSLHLDTRPSRSPGEGIWSCAKISQSAVKRATRRGHPPRRVFSAPVVVLSL